MEKTIRPIKNSTGYEDWLSLFRTPLSNRSSFLVSDSEYSFTQAAFRILGILPDPDEYRELLYNLVHEDGAQLLSGRIDKSIQPEMFQAIQRILMINTEEKGLSVNRMIAFMEGEGLLPKSKERSLSIHYRKCWAALLERYQSVHSEGFLDPDFRRVFTDLVKWSHNHLKNWTGIESGRPKLIWYGDASKSEANFLYYLILTGADVLIFHPEGTDILAAFDQKEERTAVIRLPSTGSLQPFPEQKPVRKGTVAFRASREIEQMIHTEDSLLYKPWQFRSYIPKSITLKTTYDELFILLREKALIRPNFEVSNQSVQIPALFAKVAGVSKNRKEYWARVQQVTDHELAWTIRSFPFTKPIPGNHHFHYQAALGEDGKLDPEKMMAGNWWSYKNLPTGLQTGLAAAISRYCAYPKLKSQKQEDSYQTQLYLFNQAFYLPPDVLKLIQKFDYAQDIPKIVLYNTEKNGPFSRSDAALLLLMNEFGMDITVFNPAGQNDLEHYIEESSFDVHWLEEVSFEEEFKESSPLKKIFKKWF
ncbi:hypothetical protein GKZ89_17500 [Bacillus mangrovi]|uniref:Putative component of 'biosynthetic module' domain-containing protein n=1 Tax=Metabacillus mangrovi TaxID=1491830 RepID=A0A7X2V5V3_9BACI|nr:YceG family protein [Metabacillus mangrovi]MTH55197.1 hypothetical protein [Metabacillus mangrovi]